MSDWRCCSPGEISADEKRVRLQLILNIRLLEVPLPLLGRRQAARDTTKKEQQRLAVWGGENTRRVDKPPQY